jgi:hypothetical protein
MRFGEFNTNLFLVPLDHPLAAGDFLSQVFVPPYLRLPL